MSLDPLVIAGQYRLADFDRIHQRDDIGTNRDLLAAPRRRRVEEACRPMAAQVRAAVTSADFVMRYVRYAGRDLPDRLQPFENLGVRGGGSEKDMFAPAMNAVPAPRKCRHTLFVDISSRPLRRWLRQRRVALPAAGYARRSG